MRTTKVKVPPAEGMVLQLLRRHIQKWHARGGRRLGTFNYKAHEQDHILYGNELDHVHSRQRGGGDAA